MKCNPGCVSWTWVANISKGTLTSDIELSIFIFTMVILWCRIMMMILM